MQEMGVVSRVAFNHTCEQAKVKRYAIPKKSAKRKTEEKQYSKARQVVLRLCNGRCEARIFGVCTGEAVDVHHKAKRGKYYLAINYMMGVCRSCHNYIHDNPGKARELKLLITV